MNVTGWRDDPAPQPSPLAARLLRWMSEATPALQEGCDEVAARLATAFAELSDAQSVVVWVPMAGFQLNMLGRAGDFEGEFSPDQNVSFDAEAWPTEMFWTVEGEGASRDLAVQLGLLSEKISAPSLVLPLGEAGLVLLWLDSEDGLLSDDWKPVFEMAGLQAEASLGMAERAERLNRSFRQFAEAVSRVVESREQGRDGFAEAVAYYAGVTARKMGLDEGEAQKIEFAALLHGVGRMSIPESILHKDSPLSPEELEKVRASSSLGANWLSGIDGLEEVALMVRHQGERYDGTGSPANLAGDDIPLGSRVLAVATRFTAMTLPRADRRALSVVGGAMESVAHDSGAALDPRVVEAFLRAMGRSVS